MENVLRLKYRSDLNMPDLIRPEIYGKIKNKPEIHASRITAAIERVEDAKDEKSSVNLEFCLTGYYACGKHYICAIWPKYPSLVNFHFKSVIDYNKSFPGWVSGPREGEAQSDPSEIEVKYNKKIHARSQHYMFFRENPHLPHRPYFFTRFDEMFSRQDQDDEKILTFYRERVANSLKEGHELFGGLLEKIKRTDLTAEELVIMERLSKRLKFPRDIVDEIFSML